MCECGCECVCLSVSVRVCVCESISESVSVCVCRMVSGAERSAGSGTKKNDAACLSSTPAEGDSMLPTGNERMPARPGSANDSPHKSHNSPSRLKSHSFISFIPRVEKPSITSAKAETTKAEWMHNAHTQHGHIGGVHGDADKAGRAGVRPHVHGLRVYLCGVVRMSET